MTPAATATAPTMAMWAQSTGPGMNVNGIIDQSDIQGIMATSESTGTASEAAAAAAAGTNAGAVVSASCFDSFQGDGVCNSSATVAVTASATAASAARAVMTHEQLEVLRRQICVYAAICNQLIEMHKQSLTHPSTITGFRPMAFDSMMAMPGHKMTARQRWTPTQMQLQRLESIFEEGNGTPSKQKIKDITQELMHFGSISETNVYNWFQNRRARTKRKQQQISSSCNAAESEIETDIESPLDKKGKIELHSNQEGTRQSDGFHCSDVTEQHHFESQRHGSALAFCQHMDQKPLINFGRIQSYEEGLTSSRYGQFNEMDEPMDNFSSINGMEAYPMASAMSDIGLQQNFPEALFRHTNIEQQHTSTVLQYLQRRDTEN